MTDSNGAPQDRNNRPHQPGRNNPHVPRRHHYPRRRDDSPRRSQNNSRNQSRGTDYNIRSGSQRQNPPRQDSSDQTSANTPNDKKLTRVMADTQSKSILNVTNLVPLAILAGLVFFVVKIASVFGIFLFSFLIAFLLYPMVEWLADRRVNRVLAIVIVFIVFGGILGGLAAAVIPAVVTQSNAFVEQLPQTVAKWQTDLTPRLASFKTYLEDIGVTPEDIQNYITQAVPTIQGWAINLGQKLFAGVQGAVGSIVSLFTVPIIVFYLLLDGPKIRENLMRFAPKRTATEIQELLNRLSEMLNHYIRGQLKLSFWMFVLTTAGMLLLGVKHALLLGVLAGLTEVIPIIGPIIAFIPAFLIAIFIPGDSGLFAWWGIFYYGWVRGVGVIIFYVVLQWTENNFLVPRIMGKDLNLHPLTVMFSLLAGGFLAGIFGMLLSLPIAASLKVIFETYYPAFIQRVEDLMSRRPTPDDAA